MDACLPKSTVETAARVPLPLRHPGLLLDKYSQPTKQEDQKPTLETVCQCQGDREWLRQALSRRAHTLEALPAAVTWVCRTTGPLTLHLARAGAHENVGLAFHPIYGFAHLPGSGLKGLARAYAQTVWHPNQEDQRAADDTIEAVFGCAAENTRQGQAGAVVFHDAWPTLWPELVVDITTNHHPEYYQGSGTAHPPADIENPIPVSFLAVRTGTSFAFALSARATADRSAASALVRQARDWLIGGLCLLGAGAKTAAGYGRFEPLPPAAAPQVEAGGATFTALLKFITPAFLAGVHQGKQEPDCNLRVSTVRGLLRWWWRTLHAGALDTAGLRTLEATVWGSTQTGSRIHLTLALTEDRGVKRFDFKTDRNFQRQNELQEIPPGGKTTQGLGYLSYGMDETDRTGERVSRYFVVPNSAWTLTLRARDKDILQQAQAALWLLGHYGGIGAKGRNGFGSLAEIRIPGIASIADCQRIAAEFRRERGQPEAAVSGPPQSAALGNHLLLSEIKTPWTNVWFALDQLGYAIQAFAKSHKRDPDKRGLGLPRQIHGPKDRPLPHQSEHLPPLLLGLEPQRDGTPAAKNDRHAAPIHWHVAQDAGRRIIFRCIAFPSAHLPDFATNKAFLESFHDFLGKELDARIGEWRTRGQKQEQGGSAGTQISAASQSQPQVNERVEVVLHEKAEKKNKVQWKVLHEPSGWVGSIQNAAEVPADKAVGDRVMVEVRIAKPTDFGVRWVDPDASPAEPNPKTTKGGRKRGR